MLTAITRVPSARLPECELSFLERRPIDVALARTQHHAYQDALRVAGAHVVELPPLDDLADATFVEDSAIVLDELAIIAPMGAPSRRAESETIAAVLAQYRPVERLRSPATLDGGDVLRLGMSLYVGQTPRTNAAAVTQLCAILAPRGYHVIPAHITQCLHLKSASSRLDDATVLVNPAWVDAAIFKGTRALFVAQDEAWGANTVRVGETIVFPASEPHTRAAVEKSGYQTASVDVSELQKAEAGVTCLSLIFET